MKERFIENNIEYILKDNRIIEYFFVKTKDHLHKEKRSTYLLDRF